MKQQIVISCCLVVALLTVGLNHMTILNLMEKNRILEQQFRDYRSFHPPEMPRFFFDPNIPWRHMVWNGTNLWVDGKLIPESTNQ